MAGSDAIRSLQRWLNSHGAALAVDGIVGPKTRAAIKMFQGQSGLQQTGEVSDELISALTRPPPMPHMRNAADVPPPDQLGSGNTDMTPRMRPSIDLGATGNTNFNPRLREDIPPDYSQPQPPQKLASDGNVEAWFPLSPSFMEGARQNTRDVAAGYEPGHRPVMGLDPSQLPVAQSIMQSLGPMAWAPGYWREARFAANQPQSPDFVPPDGQYADYWKGKMFNSPNAGGFDPSKPTAYRDPFGEWSVPDSNDTSGQFSPQQLQTMFGSPAVLNQLGMLFGSGAQ